MHNLGHRVRVCKVKYLSMEKIVGIEHCLCQQPVIVGIQRSIDQIGADIGLDRQRKEVARDRMDVEICATGRCISPYGHRISSLIAMVNVEKSSGAMKLGKIHS